MFNSRLAKQALQRMLLAFAAIFGAEQLFRLLLLPAMQSVFDPGDNVTIGLRRTGILLFAVLAYWAYAHFVEKRKTRELRMAPVAIVIGAVSGVGLIGLAMLLLFAAGAYEVTAYRGLDSGLWGVASVILIAATLEEVVFRCLLFQILETAFGTLPALWLQSLVFALLHIANIEDRANTQEVVTTVVSGTLLGAFWTLVFVHTRNLWVTAANHAAWNFTIILAGVPLSGLDHWLRVAPIASQYRGPAWLTGGVGGPEDSLVTIVLVAASLAFMLYWAKIRNRLLRAGAAGVDSPSPPHRDNHHG